MSTKHGEVRMGGYEVSTSPQGAVTSYRTVSETWCAHCQKWILTKGVMGPLRFMASHRDGDCKAALPVDPLAPADATFIVATEAEAREAVRKGFLPESGDLVYEPRVLPVTDPDDDAPDGAIIDGYQRQGDQWVRLRRTGL